MSKLVQAALAAALCLALGPLALAGCSNGDAEALKGEWKVKGTEVTVVFTDEKFKTAATTFDYKLEPDAKRLVFTSGSMEGGGTYTLSADGQELTIEEDDGNGGTKTTDFEKISDDKNAEPSVG